MRSRDLDYLTFCRRWLLLLVVALFITALFWTRARDPFKRVEFSLKTEHGNVGGMAVMPKGGGTFPVVIFLHGAHGTVVGSGNDLRSFAELGSAAVDIDYNQRDQAAFNEEFAALLKYLAVQSWVKKTESADRSPTKQSSSRPGLPVLAVVGFSQGAEFTLGYILKHPEFQPLLYIRMAGGWVNELYEVLQNQGLSDSGSSSALNFPLTTNTHVLLLHAEKDNIFPVADAWRLAGLFKSNAIPTELRVFPDVPHWFGDERDLLMREVSEYCANSLGSASEPENRKLGIYLQPLPRNEPSSYWYYWLPVALLSFSFFAWAYIRRRKHIFIPTPSKSGKIIKRLAWTLAVLAIAETAFYLGLPQLQITKSRLEWTRRWLIQPSLADDFDWLVQQPLWQGQRIRTLVENVELTSYNRRLAGWQVETNLYHEFVLSPRIGPVVDGNQSTDLQWRRPFWESFYPRIKNETDPDSAAQIVVRCLRERITVVPERTEKLGVETIWRTERTDREGFERIYVAALRSVGIPARLDAEGVTELFAKGAWQAAPRPMVFSLLSLNDPAGTK